MRLSRLEQLGVSGAELQSGIRDLAGRQVVIIGGQKSK